MINTDNFQTHPQVASYMVSLLPSASQVVLEPTPGKGNIVAALNDKGHTVIYPAKDFWDMQHSQYYQAMGRKYDYVVMNPAFFTYGGGLEVFNKVYGSV